MQDCGQLFPGCDCCGQMAVENYNGPAQTFLQEGKEYLLLAFEMEEEASRLEPHRVCEIAHTGAFIPFFAEKAAGGLDDDLAAVRQSRSLAVHGHLHNLLGANSKPSKWRISSTRKQDAT